MKYKDQLLHYISNFDDDDTALINWIESMPLLEQPDIFRELDQLLKDLAAEHNIDTSEIYPELNNFLERIDLYEDKILDEKLAEANIVMAQQNLDKAMQEVDEVVAGVRNYVIDCIVNKEENADAMRELAQKMIQQEKDNDIYNPENWKRLF